MTRSKPAKRRPPVAKTPAVPGAQVEELDERGELAAAWQAEMLAGIRTTAAVRAARAAGLSWHQVGLVVHYTAEGARRKWGALLGESQ